MIEVMNMASRSSNVLLDKKVLLSHSWSVKIFNIFQRTNSIIDIFAKMGLDLLMAFNDL